MPWPVTRSMISPSLPKKVFAPDDAVSESNAITERQKIFIVASILDGEAFNFAEDIERLKYRKKIREQAIESGIATRVTIVVRKFNRKRKITYFVRQFQVF